MAMGPNGDTSLRKLILNQRAFEIVLSITGRAIACCSIVASVVIGAAAADRVVAEGLRPIEIDPRGNGPRDRTGRRAGQWVVRRRGGGACPPGTVGSDPRDNLNSSLRPFPTRRL